jgi:hypothetical protein
VSGIASSRSPSRRFYCLERKREFILKFREVKMTFFFFFKASNNGLNIEQPSTSGPLGRIWVWRTGFVVVDRGGAPVPAAGGGTHRPGRAAGVQGRRVGPGRRQPHALRDSQPHRQRHLREHPGEPRPAPTPLVPQSLRQRLRRRGTRRAPQLHVPLRSVPQQQPPYRRRPGLA